MEMNILFSSDDNYARHLGVAMYSLMLHNQKFDKLNFFVVDNHISEDNRAKLIRVVNDFRNSNLSFIPFIYYAKRLQLDMPWPISMSAYARIFAAEMLPKDIDRVLYLDSDMVVNSHLSELWEIELGKVCVGAVQDQVFPRIKKAVGLDFDSPYFNSGLLLLNLSEWRKQNIGEKCIKFINNHNGRVVHHDQGVLNGVLRDNWVRIPLKFNLMTIHFFFNQKTSLRYFKDCSPFYNEEEIEAAKKEPSILHFTPSFTSHPWERNCNHPQKEMYLSILGKTPWNGVQLEPEKESLYLRLLNWRYRVFKF